MLASDDKPRGAYFWARRWRCNHCTARRVLAHLHRTLGSRVVWRVGPQRALMTTEAALRVVSVLRQGEHADEEEIATVGQLRKAVEQLRREIAELR